MSKKKLEKERAEFQAQHDRGTTEDGNAILRSRIAYLDYKIAFATDA